MENQNNPEKWNNKLLAQDILNAFKMNKSTNQTMETILFKKIPLEICLWKWDDKKNSNVRPSSQHRIKFTTPK